MKPTPTFATWFLKVFCSSPEHESMIGDLAEQYAPERGRGWFWYWRQVLSIVFLRVYETAARRPLLANHRIHAGVIFAVILVAIALFGILKSGIAPILLIPVVIGSWLGSIRAYNSRERRPPAVSSESPDLVRIDSSKISISGGIGAGILIIMLLGSALIELPELRFLAAPGLLAGLAFAGILRLWRRSHPRDITKDWLSIKSK
jgi:hypothetical protein